MKIKKTTTEFTEEDFSKATDVLHPLHIRLNRHSPKRGNIPNNKYLHVLSTKLFLRWKTSINPTGKTFYIKNIKLAKL